MLTYSLRALKGCLAMALSCVAIAAPAAIPSRDTLLESEIRKKDQAMMDAFASGDRAVFDAMLAPEAVYLDENGKLMSRSGFLEQLRPLPKNVSGHIELGDYKLRHFGNTATVTFVEIETENYHGQILHTNSLTSETWLNTIAGWKLAMEQTMVIQKVPPSIELPLRVLRSYVGTYSGGADLVYEISVRNGGLFGTRPGQPSFALLAEVKDVFFVAGAPRTRKIFLRDAVGKITGFVDRREGEDLVWRRVSLGQNDRNR